MNQLGAAADHVAASLGVLARRPDAARGQDKRQRFPSSPPFPTIPTFPLAEADQQAARPAFSGATDALVDDARPGLRLAQEVGVVPRNLARPETYS